MSSLRRSLIAFSNLKLDRGILHHANCFYKKNSIAINLRWLKTYDEIISIGNRPRDPPHGLLLTRNIQGVTFDGFFWYFTNNSNDIGIVWKIPRNKDLTQISPHDNDLIVREVPQKLLEQKYWHYGDLDHYNGHIYIALEASERDKEFGKIVAYRASDMSFAGSADLTSNIDDRAPWCAINPRNGLLYTSSFYKIKPEQVKLQVYRPSIGNNNFNLFHVGEFPLYDNDGSAMDLSKIQGGAFSPNGNLYLVSDETGGIIVFDMIFGRKFAQIKVEYRPERHQELEGITIFDFGEDILIFEDEVKIELAGAIHLLMLDFSNPFSHIAYFKHFKVSPWKNL